MQEILDGYVNRVKFCHNGQNATFRVLKFTLCLTRHHVMKMYPILK